MFRIDDPSNVAVEPGRTAIGTEGWFRRGVSGGAQGTILTEEWANMAQNEMEAVHDLHPASPARDKTNDSQMAEAIAALLTEHTKLSASWLVEGFQLTKVNAEDIAIAPGFCRGNANTLWINDAAGRTKQADVTWGPGADGGMPASLLPLAADTQYFVFAMTQASGAVDSGFDILESGANLLLDAQVITAGYTEVRAVGVLYTDGAAAWHDFVHSSNNLNHVLFENPVQVYDHIAPPAFTVSVPVFGPAGSVGQFVVLRRVVASPSEVYTSVVSGDAVAAAPTALSFVTRQRISTTEHDAHAVVELIVGAAGNIWYRVSALDGFIEIMQLGYQWNRSGTPRP